jgi:hypothetical protein
MSRGSSSGKRPQAKLKVMAKLGENLYKTTKIYRFLAARRFPKPKWNTFLNNTSEEYRAWQQWWASPQSARWKNLEQRKAEPPPPADAS